MITHWIRNDSNPALDPHQSCTHRLPGSCRGCTKGRDSRQACRGGGGDTGCPCPLAMGGWARLGVLGMFWCKLSASPRSQTSVWTGCRRQGEDAGLLPASPGTNSPLHLCELPQPWQRGQRTLKTKRIQGPASKGSSFYPCCSQKMRLHSTFVVILMKAPGHFSASLIWTTRKFLSLGLGILCFY